MSTLVICLLVLAASLNIASSMICGDHTAALRGEIRRPSQGNEIRHDFKCSWTITVPEKYRIRIHAKEISLPSRTEEGTCSSDLIFIESLTADEKRVSHGDFCGTTMPNVTSLENRLHILYIHYGSWDKHRFVLEHEAVLHTPRELTEVWIRHHTQSFFEPKASLPRAVAALYLFDERYFHRNNATGTDLATQFYLQLSSDLVRNITRPMSASDLSHHVNALLALCRNPASFFGLDLMDRLRKLVKEEKGLSNPYYFLTLCNAGEKMTYSDVETLIEITRINKEEIFWTDFQAIALIALVCIDQQDNGYHLTRQIQEASEVLQKHQQRNGTFGSLQTTSLAIQALQAAEDNHDYRFNRNMSSWDKSSAMQFVARKNNTDGSFGNMYDLYAIIPVLTGKTLLYLNATRCDFSSDELTSLREIKNKINKTIELTYSIWIGDHIDFSTTLTLKAPHGTSFLDFMRLASEKDEKFRFQWEYIKHVSHVHQIYGVVNDPASGKYWTLHTGRSAHNVQPFKKGLENYIPRDGDVAVLWYRTITIEHSWRKNETIIEWPENETIIEWPENETIIEWPENETIIEWPENETTIEWSLYNQTTAPGTPLYNQTTTPGSPLYNKTTTPEWDLYNKTASEWPRYNETSTSGWSYWRKKENVSDWPYDNNSSLPYRKYNNSKAKWVFL